MDAGRGAQCDLSLDDCFRVYIWIVLVLAGVSMFVLARRWLDRRDAIFAAVLYAVNPYHLVIVYWRSAFAELLASCLVPLLLLLVLKAADGGAAGDCPAGTGAGRGVADECSGGGDDPLFAGAAGGVVRVEQRRQSVLARGCGAVASGRCFAAFYLLPAIYEQRWVEHCGGGFGGIAAGG